MLTPIQTERKQQAAIKANNKAANVHSRIQRIRMRGNKLMQIIHVNVDVACERLNRVVSIQKEYPTMPKAISTLHPIPIDL